MKFSTSVSLLPQLISKENFTAPHELVSPQPLSAWRSDSNSRVFSLLFFFLNKATPIPPAFASLPPSQVGLLWKPRPHFSLRDAEFLTFTVLPPCQNVSTHHCSDTQQADGNRDEMDQPVPCTEDEPGQSHQHRNPKTIQ